MSKLHVYDVSKNNERGKFYIEVVDPDDKSSGFYFTFQSSYISGGYYWGSPGAGGWKEFLNSISLDYFGDKILGKESVGFDYALTCGLAIEQILKFRRNKEITEDTARTAYHMLKHDDPCGLETFFERMIACGMVWEDIDCLICFSKNPDLVNFWGNVWPHFLHEINTERTPND